MLVSSLSNLGTRGLTGYAEALVSCLASMGARVGQGREVIPLVHLHLGWIGDAGMVRDAYNMDAWIMSSGLGPGVLPRASRSRI